MDDEGSNLVTITSHKHHKTLVDGLWNLFRSKRGLDFDVRLEDGRSVRAHRLVLEVFLEPSKLDLEQTDAAEDSSSDEGSLDFLLEFLYNGSVKLPSEQLEGLLEVARQLNFSLLVEALESALAENDSVAKSRKEINAATSWKPVAAPRAKNRRSARVANTKPIRPTKKKTGSAEKVSGKVMTSGVKKRNSESALRGKVVKARTARTKSSASSSKTSEGAESKAEGRPGQVLRCEKCDFETRHRTSLTFHLLRHDPSATILRCKLCDRRFVKREVYERHFCVPKKRVPRVYPCPHCNYRSSRKFRLDAHLAEHDPSITVFKCHECFMPFVTSLALQKHEAKHKTYSCMKCDFKTKKRWGLHAHLTNVHGVTAKGDPVQTVSCDQCDFTCHLQGDLITHKVSKHNEEKPFKCLHCPYATSRKHQIPRHMKVAHLNLKSNMCEVCGFLTESPYKLAQHARTHSGEKPYKCEVCSQVFAHRSSLTMHTRLHAEGDVRKFACQVCGRVFKRRYHLKVHSENVHKVHAANSHKAETAGGPPTQDQVIKTPTGNPNLYRQLQSADPLVVASTLAPSFLY